MFWFLQNNHVTSSQSLTYWPITNISRGWAPPLQSLGRGELRNRTVRVWSFNWFYSPFFMLTMVILFYLIKFKGHPNSKPEILCYQLLPHLSLRFLLGKTYFYIFLIRKNKVTFQKQWLPSVEGNGKWYCNDIWWPKTEVVNKRIGCSWVTLYPEERKDNFHPLHLICIIWGASIFCIFLPFITFVLIRILQEDWQCFMRKWVKFASI